MGVMRENSCGYPWQEQPGADAGRAEMAQAEIRIWVRGQSGRENHGSVTTSCAEWVHGVTEILNVVGLPVPDATGGRLEILCRLGGEK